MRSLRELKASPDLASVPVIVLSVLHDRDNGLQLGAADYLTKPIRGKELLESVERAFGELGAGQGASRSWWWMTSQTCVAGCATPSRCMGSAWRSGRRARGDGAGGSDGARSHPARPEDAAHGWLYRSQADSRADPAKADIPIVVLTASSINKERDEMRLLDMGAKRFLTKPIAVDELVGEIEQQLAAKVKAND